jgi:hypothetical protein
MTSASDLDALSLARSGSPNDLFACSLCCCCLYGRVETFPVRQLGRAEPSQFAKRNPIPDPFILPDSSETETEHSFILRKIPANATGDPSGGNFSDIVKLFHRSAVHDQAATEAISQSRQR